LKLALRAACVDDIQGAYGWYELQRNGLGGEFLQSLVRTLTLITEHPLRFRVVGSDLRQALVRRFPYRVIYRIVGEEVVVVACFHAQRDPRIWTSRQ